MKKEIAKFLSGATAWESFTHFSLWFSGVEPIVFGIKMSHTLNAVQIFIPAIVSMALAYYAWNKK
jgi:hypothetical protein